MPLRCHGVQHRNKYQPLSYSVHSAFFLRKSLKLPLISSICRFFPEAYKQMGWVFLLCWWGIFHITLVIRRSFYLHFTWHGRRNASYIRSVTALIIQTGKCIPLLFHESLFVSFLLDAMKFWIPRLRRESGKVLLMNVQTWFYLILFFVESYNYFDVFCFAQ